MHVLTLRVSIYLNLKESMWCFICTLQTTQIFQYYFLVGSVLANDFTEFTTACFGDLKQ